MHDHVCSAALALSKDERQYTHSRQLESSADLLIHMLAEGNKHTITAMLTQPTQLVEGP